MILSSGDPKLVAAVVAVFLLFLLGMASAGVAPAPVQGYSWQAHSKLPARWERPAVQTSAVVPSSGPPGTSITVSGTGFRSFDTVESIVMGGLDILGNRTVNTNGDGEFEISGLIVPGLDPGIVSLTVRVGTGDRQTTAVGTFEVTEETAPSGQGAPPADALSPLGDVLERVFHFDNSTKTWSFYDPREEFADANTLEEIVQGRVYWIKVQQSTTSVLNGVERELTCANPGTPREDCWNLVVW